VGTFALNPITANSLNLVTHTNITMLKWFSFQTDLFITDLSKHTTFITDPFITDLFKTDHFHHHNLFLL